MKIEIVKTVKARKDQMITHDAMFNGWKWLDVEINEYRGTGEAKPEPRLIEWMHCTEKGYVECVYLSVNGEKVHVKTSYLNGWDVNVKFTVLRTPH